VLTTIKILPVMKYKNDNLAEVVAIAKSKGYKVFGFQKNIISQVFIENTNGKVGTCSAGNSDGVHFGTVHKRSQIGTGFRVDGGQLPTEVETCFAFAPNWASPHDIKHIKKYSSFDDYLKFNTVLNYFEI